MTMIQIIDIFRDGEVWYAATDRFEHAMPVGYCYARNETEMRRVYLLPMPTHRVDVERTADGVVDLGALPSDVQQAFSQIQQTETQLAESFPN